MVNSQVQKEINNAFKIDERVEKSPSPIPVVEVGIKGCKSANIIRSLNNTNFTSEIVYTTPADQDFYLTYANLQARINGGTETLITLTIVVDSVRQALLSLPNIAALATTNGTSFFAGNHPIKIDRNTTITMTCNVAEATSRGNCNIVGYLDEIA